MGPKLEHTSRGGGGGREAAACAVDGPLERLCCARGVNAVVGGKAARVRAREREKQRERETKRRGGRTRENRGG